MTLRRRVRAAAWLWAWELAGAAVIAGPVHAWARSEWGTHPDGDATLFRAGGHALLSWLDDGSVALPIVLRASLVALVVVWLTGPLATGTSVAALVLDEDGRPPALLRALRAALGAFVPLVMVGVATAAFEGIVLAAGGFAAAGLDRLLQAPLGDARAFNLHLVPIVLFAIVAAMVGVVGDLARADVARGAILDEGPLGAARRVGRGVAAALRTARGSVVRTTLAWGWRAALALLLLYGGAVSSDLIGGRGAGGLALVALVVVHQLVMAGRVVLRLSWLDYTLARVTPVDP
jgi:hypothetical protein